MNEPTMCDDLFYKMQSYPRYTLPFGDTEIVVVSDGRLDLGAPEDSFRELSKEEMDEQLSRNFLPTDKVVIEQNIPILTSGGKRILFEAGMGSLKMFGTDSGVFKLVCKRQELIQGRSMPSYVRIPTPITLAV